MRAASLVLRPSSMSAIPPARLPTSNTSKRGATPASSKGWNSVEGKQSRGVTRMTQTAAEMPREIPKDASASVVAQHAATLKALPFSDVRDFDDAARGFLGTIENATLPSPQVRLVLSLEPYAYQTDDNA